MASDFRNAALAVVPILTAVVAVHRGFAFTFALSILCASAIVARREQYWSSTKYSPKKITVLLLSVSLFVALLWEVNAWAKAGKPNRPLLGLAHSSGPLQKSAPNLALQWIGYAVH